MNLYTFQRYELKYLITQSQYQAVLRELPQYTTADKHGQSTVQSLYYDTEQYRLIRRSIERPDYKEKLRLRSYGLAQADDNVFLELKKKSNGIVFKRRIELQSKNVTPFLNGQYEISSQIAKEIQYFLSFYEPLRPSLLLLYDRTAYFGEGDLRITFDANVRYRNERLTLNGGLDGIPVLPDRKIVMEIKTSTGFPLQLAHLLSREHIQKTPFSKYGEAYQLECRYKEDRKVG